MDPRKFHFPIAVLADDGRPERLRGNSFSITANGDLLTCRHVVSVLEGTRLGVVDQELGRVVPISSIQMPTDDTVDLALLPQALRRSSSYFPLLTPGSLLVGSDVSTYGFYSHGAGWAGVTDGYFAGHVVSFRTKGPITMTLPFPVIEGLSGSPVTTYHNGTKVVGICFGSESQRVLASEILEFKEGSREVRETINRVVEFGLAYRVEVVQSFCAGFGVTPTVSSESVASAGDLG